jgi:cellulose synthase/poly-beta-1,6-N-acetylglucosamine synthase-like glycosyltransferase
MSSAVVAYPFLFITVFFEVFVLVTFLSRPARERRSKTVAQSTPKVAIVVPCWNEETTLAGTVESLLALDYPKKKLSLILINDGSTDGTASVMEQFAKHPQITSLHKENGGKFTAMNLGIAHAADADLIGFLDADSMVAPDSLREIVTAFEEPGIDAVTAALSIHKPRTLLQRMQYAEYMLAMTFQHVFASLNGLSVTPGPFSFFRRSIFANIGMFKHAYLAEDMEMAMRMQRAGLRISNAIRARVYTKGPPTLPKLMKQRTRWITGFLRNVFFDYRDLLGNQKNKALGMFVLPFSIIAIGGAIILFLYSAVQLISQSFHAFSLAQSVPLSYALSLHSFSWLYFPVTISSLFCILLIISNFFLMAIGKNLSKTPGNLVTNGVLFFLLYSLIAPFWLIRAVSDVALGVRTTWR